MPARPPNGSQLANHFLSIKYNLRGSGFGVLFGYFKVGKVTKGPVYPVTEMILHPAAPETALLQLAHFWHDESAQDLIEYALVAALVGLASVTGIHGIAAVISHSINVVVNRFTTVVSAAI
jgi:pilus assembly protein Flp/PilA